VTEPERYFFLHIPKTAGIALNARLRHQFGENAMYPFPADRLLPGTPIEVGYLKERFDAHRSQIRVVTGHFPLCVTDVLGVPFRTFTVLRNPVERILSLLRHHRQRVERFQERPLEEIYDDPFVLHGLIHNYMVKVFSLTADEMKAGAKTMVAYNRDRLARAQENLECRVELIGFQEHFEDFCERLAARFGWEQLGEPSFPNRTAPVDVSDEFQERIARDNEMDIELYGFAQQLVGRPCAPS
jgi:hypothetical protein